ncbi:HAAS signaling domain-containing protein [Agrococcus jejuensis]|uniref:Uncharacterized protein n=1 Tax=Agrococcus jejuensis TaxID=399736 RepID=A0A1G8CYY7_9MICO|nr:hypothetical protein [Agrococcus jejuensis]SDH50701.1 hypothetical protein SAMN04489720_1459 [Agrococcus jejuensis]
MTATDPVADYLARLDDALRDVPFGTAREIRAGIAEELGSLHPAAARARIAELGDPASIAAEAADGSVSTLPATAAPTGYGRGPGYVAVTALLIGLGGFLLPVLGWIAGIVALWTGRVWTTFERWIATLAPVVASVLVVGIWWAVQSAASAQPTPPGDGFHAPESSPSPVVPGSIGAWWTVWLGTSVGGVVIGIWLAVIGMRRVRR